MLEGYENVRAYCYNCMSSPLLVWCIYGLVKTNNLIQANIGMDGV
jgi:hypothetical protein